MTLLSSDRDHCRRRRRRHIKEFSLGGAREHSCSLWCLRDVIIGIGAAAAVAAEHEIKAQKFERNSGRQKENGRLNRFAAKMRFHAARVFLSYMLLTAAGRPDGRRDAVGPR